jgi:glutamyl-tRNA synthetase
MVCIIMDYLKLAELLLPDTNVSTEEILDMYPKRSLPANAKVTRFAPSPTGFLHMGGLFAALISERLAHQSSGVFFLRIEDTDKKREIEGSITGIINSLNYFRISFDEGEIKPGKEIGEYGPYKQSERGHIYKAFVKELVKRGMAYPCFCSTEDLNGLRIRQKSEKQLTGYYGKWAKCRNASMDEIHQRLSDGSPFVIRLKSPGSPDGLIVHNDLIKGEIRFPENTHDVVILKSDGLPTYHFAHAVDDHLMGTTHVFRGDEWLSSVPIHIQLFEVQGWDPPFYGHISPIMKMDGSSKRKFSKRKDPEFAVSWYQEQGYSGCAVAEYLLGLANSNYEEWRLENPNEPYENFTVSIGKMSSSGALFDINKFNDVCRNVIAKLSSDEIYNALLEWSAQYDKELHDLVTKHKDYTIKILSIGRGSNRPRKDFANWSGVKPAISYFYDELYSNCSIQNCWPEAINKADAAEIIRAFIGTYDETDDNTVWFGKIKSISEQLGYARDMKSFKKAPSAFKGHVGDTAMVLRIALTGRANTPELYEIMQVMGKSRVIERLKRCLNLCV